MTRDGFAHEPEVPGKVDQARDHELVLAMRFGDGHRERIDQLEQVLVRIDVRHGENVWAANSETLLEARVLQRRGTRPGRAKDHGSAPRIKAETLDQEIAKVIRNEHDSCGRPGPCTHQPAQKAELKPAGAPQVPQRRRVAERRGVLIRRHRWDPGEVGNDIARTEKDVDALVAHRTQDSELLDEQPADEASIRGIHDPDDDAAEYVLPCFPLKSLMGSTACEEHDLMMIERP